MKNYIILLAILLGIITSCQSSRIEPVIELPPMPQRQELKSPETLKDYVEIINYYEHLVQEYEVWADTVTKMIEEPLLLGRNCFCKVDE